MDNKHIVSRAANVELDAVSTHGAGSSKSGHRVFALSPRCSTVGEYLYSVWFSHDLSDFRSRYAHLFL
jgi:hypothetical protein